MTGITLATGMQLIREKQYESVYNQAIESLKKNEKNPLSFFLLGVLATDTGNHEKALEFFSKAAEHGPNNVHYQTYFAKALTTFAHHEQAKIHADKAAVIGTNDALLADMIGVVYSKVGHHELAIPFFEKATRLNPRWAKFHFNLGASAEFIGNFGKAKKAYTNTLSIDPNFYLAWFSLVSLSKQTYDNHHLEKLTALFDASVGNVEAQLLLGHAIAKTLEDLERFEESFDWLEKGKEGKRTQVNYSQQAWSEVFETAKQTIPSPTINDGNEEHLNSSITTPLFIVGLPRTGTTLVDRILSSHKQVRSAGELNLFGQLVKAAIKKPINANVEIGDFLDADKVDWSLVGKNYREKTHHLAQGARYLVDKMPLNIFYVGCIQRALPEAKIIILRRGAMDSCLSNFRQLFSFHNHNYDYSLSIEDTASFFRNFTDMVSHWREHSLPNRLMEITYENIVFDQEKQTQDLLSFCDLPWDESCMRFHENEAPVSTASSVQVRQPLYSGSIGRWKKYGTKLDKLKAILAPDES